MYTYELHRRRMHFWHVRKIIEHTHPATMSVRALQHYSLMIAMRWAGGL